MSLSRPSIPPKRLAASDGFMLIELIVSLVAGLTVTAVACMMLHASLGQAARVSSSADATQRGTAGLERVMSLLHSSCVAPGVAPVQTGSDGSRLLIVSEAQAAGGASPFAAVRLHEIALVHGKLEDTSYASVGTKPAPEWEFAPAGTTRTLATDVSPSGTTPVFQYFADAPSSELQGTPLAAPLSSAAAAQASVVTVTFTVGVQDGRSSGDYAHVLSNTAQLRLAGSSSGETAPCT